MIYLKKTINWFSCAKKLVIKKAAAGIIKFRDLSSQKLEIFEHLHSHKNDLQRTSLEYCISNTKTVVPHNEVCLSPPPLSLCLSLSVSTHTHTRTSISNPLQYRQPLSTLHNFLTLLLQ